MHWTLCAHVCIRRCYKDLKTIGYVGRLRATWTKMLYKMKIEKPEIDKIDRLALLKTTYYMMRMSESLLCEG